MLSRLLILTTITLLTIISNAENYYVLSTNEYTPIYIMCVPNQIFESCKKMMSKPSEYATIVCMSGRDRIDCLEKVNARKADFLAADPEDMYIAHTLANEDFVVFSDIRTIEEPEANYRYEGIILVRKNSTIQNLANLKGKKSCHTGFGRNVGYKIPITKLKKHGILKLTKTPQLSSVEKELKALSEFFSGSCLVGTYSPNEEVNRLLKKRYANLCQLCEDPVKCDYPDKYSGYEGAIKCLAENGGDVAFTKVIYVKRYFGLPIGNTPSKFESQGNPNDYEYLCEDGTRRSISDGPVCTWAQRPWQGYMGNADIYQNVKRLQDRINEFYTDGKTSDDKKAASDMWINDKNLIVKKDENITPGSHLAKAQYIDVIERDGSTQQKIRFCVTSDIELEKCEALRKVAYARDIRPEFVCVQTGHCISAVQENKADVTILHGIDYRQGRRHNLMPVIWEQYENHYVAIADKMLKDELIRKPGLPITFDEKNSRSTDAALNLNYHRLIDSNHCAHSLKSSPFGEIQIINSNQLNDNLPQFEDKELICSDFSRRPLGETNECNFDATLPQAIFVRQNVQGQELDNILHGFISLTEKFGRNGKLEDVFKMFGEFEPNESDVMFTDDSVRLVTSTNFKSDVDEDTFYRIHCYNEIEM